MKQSRLIDIPVSSTNAIDPRFFHYYLLILIINLKTQQDHFDSAKHMILLKCIYPSINHAYRAYKYENILFFYDNNVRRDYLFACLSTWINYTILAQYCDISHNTFSGRLYKMRISIIFNEYFSALNLL